MKRYSLRGSISRLLLAAFCVPLSVFSAFAADTVFTNVDVVDVAAGQVLADRTVTVRDGRVHSMVAAGAGEIAQDAKVIDGEGYYMTPGLADMHTHVSKPDQLIVNMAHGVTTVRVMWGDSNQKALGYDFVKVYSRLQRSVFDAIAAAGRRHDMDVSGHVPQAVPFRHAVEAGMRTSEHFVGVLHAVFRDQSLPSPDVSPMFDEAKQFMEQVGRGEINVEGLIDWRKVKELSAWLAGRKHWLVPTHHIMRNFTDNPLPPFEAGLRYLTPEERMLVHGDVGEFFGLTEDQKKGETLMYELRTDILKAFHDAGAKIMVGTDQQTMVGLATVAEMQALEQAGMSRADALRAATTVTADYLGRSGEFGEVREGAVADLILVKGNPLKDLAALNAMLDEVSEKMAALKE